MGEKSLIEKAIDNELPANEQFKQNTLKDLKISYRRFIEDEISSAEKKQSKKEVPVFDFEDFNVRNFISEDAASTYALSVQLVKIDLLKKRFLELFGVPFES